MKVTKAEGYLEAVQDKIMTPFQLNIIKVFTIAIIVMVILMVAKNMGFLPFLE
jgi:hypothetical protein